MKKRLEVPKTSIGFKLDYEVHHYTEVYDYLEQHKNEFPSFQVKEGKSKKRDMVKYYNISSAFDIETSTFFNDSNGIQYSVDDRNSLLMNIRSSVVNPEVRAKELDKIKDSLVPKACLTCWQIGFNGVAFLGRTWDELKECTTKIQEILELGKIARIVVYVHNLSYEFQWIRKHFEWDKVFAVGPRKPIRALTTNGIEFRDSLILTGKSLEKSCEDLHKYVIAKQTGDWEYTKIRTTITPLTEDEKRYAIYDVLGVMAIIQEKLEEEILLSDIPMTNTGYVRRFCREQTIFNSDEKVAKSYNGLIRSLKVTAKEYKNLKFTFMGGFTHANSLYVGETLSNVGSYDLTSDYPSQMVIHKFPMGKAPTVEITNVEQLEYQCSHYCCMFLLSLKNVQSKLPTEHIISESKCSFVGNKLIDNGRVVSADQLSVWVTEQDYYNIKDCYTYDGVGINEFTRYYKQYLPKNLILAILELYKQKTTLKGIDEAKIMYMLYKGMLNSVYGMSVTDIVNMIETYEDDQWKDSETPDVDSVIDKYNKSWNRFLYYPWGVWVTAYARRTLIKAIIACGDNYVYSDTDSIKFIYENSEHVKRFVEYYNEQCLKALHRTCDYYDIDYSLIAPKTNKGETKVLGYWDFEGVYDNFKTLGAKRYCYSENGKFKVTVAGANKKLAAQYLIDNCGDETPFDLFKDGVEIDEIHSGRNIHMYIDEEFKGDVIDYMGNTASYHELSAVALTNASFTLNLSDDFEKYLNHYAIRYDCYL